MYGLIFIKEGEYVIRLIGMCLLVNILGFDSLLV